MKKGIWKLGIPTLTLVLLVGGMFAGSAAAEPTNKIVDPKMAEKVAVYYAALLWGEDKTEIGGPELYFDLDDKPAAYVFTIVKKGETTLNKDESGTKEQKNFGTLVIGATKDHTPFIEAYDGLPPHEKADKVKKIARRYNANDGGHKYIFLRSFDYGVELESNGKKIKVNLRTKKVIPNGKPVQIGQEKQKEIRKQWNLIAKIIERSSVGGVQAQTYSVLISDVPFYLWYRGCSPTAAGMVMGYWHYHGYPNLPTGNTLIDELADAMGTSSSGATWPWKIDDGIRTVASNHGYNFGSTNYYGTGYWGTYKSEINNARPMVISIAVDLGGPYDDHTVAGVGYYEPHFWEKNAIVQDTWDTVWHYVNVLVPPQPI